MNAINILIPSAGFASHDLLRHILEHKQSHYRLILADMNESIPSRHIAHAFYQAPASTAPDYLHFILNVCEQESVNVILPGKSADARFFAENENVFKSKNIAVILSPAQTIFDTLDKAKCMSLLSKHGIAVPDYYEITSIDEFLNAAKQLGYPDKPICIKPSKYPSESGRGFRIIDASINTYHRFFWEQTSELYFVSFNQVLEAMRNEDNFPPQMVMEYLPYDEYSVYCLCEKGSLIYSIPNRRISLYQMSTLEAVVDLNEEILEVTSQICEVFAFDYLINIQLKYSVDHIPKIVEINPRMAGTIMLSVKAGVDLIHFAISKALGYSYDKCAKVQNGFRIRRELTPYYYES